MTRPDQVHVTIDEIVVAGLSRTEAAVMVGELRRSLVAHLATDLTTSGALTAAATAVPAVRVETPRGSGAADLGRAVARGVAGTLRPERGA